MRQGTTTNTASAPALPVNKGARHKCKYRVRWFYSRGAFLVLAWITLVSIAGFSMEMISFPYLHRQFTNHRIAILVPQAIAFSLAIILGWLADTKYGNYKVAKFGLILQFVGALGISLNSLLVEYLKELNNYFAAVLFSTAMFPFMVGLACFMVTSLQLGLDQMPDASSKSITSFIAWFVFCLFTGSLISRFLYYVQWHCEIYSFSTSNNLQIGTLQAVVCTTFALILDFIFTKKWLIIEPNSPHSLKTMYQVLKFAAKHKAPLNRSAFTYWEEDIPSRIDLGKSKYGGPFTTEQVEDVKTILRLLVISLPLWLVGFSLYMFTYVKPPILPGLKTCNTYLIASFTYHHEWCVIIGTLVYEFALYPILKNKIPTILKRIGIASFLITLLNTIMLILELIQYFYNDTEALRWTTSTLYSMCTGLLIHSFSCAVIELVVAQAPYNMRGLSIGYTAILVFSSIFLGDTISNTLLEQYITFAIKLVFSLLGFILYCLLASWYRRRVRDDVFSSHKVVEEVYDRYLTARAEHTQHQTNINHKFIFDCEKYPSVSNYT